MKNASPVGTTCAKCHASLEADGRCLPCLLRGGLAQEPLTESSPAAASSPVPTPAPGPTVYGEFEITRRDDGSLWELGRGAMGVTYRALDQVLHRLVALKVIQLGAVPAGDAALGEALRERFLREARAAAALRHGNVAGVFRFGVEPGSGRCYYAMELVEGETLEARVRRDGPLDSATTLGIASQVAAALVAAAGRGLIHRDLKPGNLMLEGAGGPFGRLEVKVIDFGLAKAVVTAGKADLTHGGFVGTPIFASPEQFARQPVDARTDIYSLGVTLWYALTGRVPFAGNSFEDVRDHPGRLRLPVEQLTARKVPPAFVALLRAMLAEDPAQRPASARELAAALESCRSSGPGGSQPPLPGKGKPAVDATLAICAILGIILAAVGIAWWATRTSPAGVPGSAAAGVAAIPEKSLAVLPFDNFSADKDSAFFADGVQDEVLTDLAKVADLKVISRTSVLSYKDPAKRSNLREIGRALGVAYVVEGSVQRAGDRIRVTAQLIDARTDAHLWAGRYDRGLQDVFAIQSEIAQGITGELQAKLSPGERSAIDAHPTANLAAYNAYLLGKNLLCDENAVGKDLTDDVVRFLEEAVTRDPQFVQAWCELSMANVYLYWAYQDHTPERLARAEDAFQNAHRLQPDAGEVHLAAGTLRYHGYRDFAGATSELQAAARLLPNDPEVETYLGALLRRQSRWDECLPHFERAITLDPRSVRGWLNLARTEYHLRRYARAVRALDQALEIDPGNLDCLENKAHIARDERADLQPMRDWLRSLPANSDTWHDDYALFATLTDLDASDFPAAARDFASYQPAIWNTEGFIWPRAFFEGKIARFNGNEAAASTALLAARQAAEETAKKPSEGGKAWMVLATIDAWLGRKEDALREAETAVAMQRDFVDHITGRMMAQYLAALYVVVGERERAIDTLRAAASQPSGPTYGALRLERDWDPLRGNPRFEALVASLAPKR